MTNRYRIKNVFTPGYFELYISLQVSGVIYTPTAIRSRVNVGCKEDIHEQTAKSKDTIDEMLT